MAEFTDEEKGFLDLLMDNHKSLFGVLDIVEDEDDGEGENLEDENSDQSDILFFMQSGYLIFFFCFFEFSSMMGR